MHAATSNSPRPRPLVVRFRRGASRKMYHRPPRPLRPLLGDQVRADAVRVVVALPPVLVLEQHVPLRQGLVSTCQRAVTAGCSAQPLLALRRVHLPKCRLAARAVAVCTSVLLILAVSFNLDMRSYHILAVCPLVCRYAYNKSTSMHRSTRRRGTPRRRVGLSTRSIAACAAKQLARL